MLTQIRKGADNFFIKLLLGLIAFSFVGVGAASFLQGNSKGDVVTFSNADPISTESFLIAKSKEIEAIQRDNGINLTEQQINELGIDRAVLQRLINEAMIDCLAKHYDLDISDNTIAEFVKKDPFFKNQEGVFDPILLKQAFRNSKQQEQEYLSNVKRNIIKGTIFDVFIVSFKPSTLMIENVVNYMAESRIFDLIQIDLDYKRKDFKNFQPEQKELKEFYQSNESMFVLPETRSFDYIKTNRKFLENKLNISEEELKNYFEENKDEFKEAVFANAKSAVKEVVQSNKIEELMAELSKNFEDDIAAGLSLKEIASKYELQISSVGNQSQSSMNTSANDDLVQLSDSVFEMTEGEISYPIELQDQNEIILVELKSIQLSKQQEFEEVKDKALALWQQRNLMAANLESLGELHRNFDQKKLQDLGNREKGVDIIVNKSITRIDLNAEEKLPSPLLRAVFQVSKGEITPIIREGNKAYFAYIKMIKTNQIKAKKIKEVNQEHIKNTIKEGIMQEIITHLTKKNKMQIKL